LEVRRLWPVMKIILSRKGFDSSAGKKPSPIFPDGTMVSLPIPDKTSPIAYKDIAGNASASVGELVQDLAGRPPTHRAHLDPDLSAHSIPRADGWRPLFGQEGDAESHLENQGVGPGDIFLFFGLFREVEKSGDGWRYVRGSRPMHVIFGWLQAAKRVAVSNWPADAVWALYHPHFRREAHPQNVVYVGAERLTLPGLESSAAILGAGLFAAFAPKLQLTEPQCSRPGLWLLPEWFHPDGRDSALTYHGGAARWPEIESWRNSGFCLSGPGVRSRLRRLSRGD
jgi:hypothetical protein